MPPHSSARTGGRPSRRSLVAAVVVVVVAAARRGTAAAGAAAYEEERKKERTNESTKMMMMPRYCCLSWRRLASQNSGWLAGWLASVVKGALFRLSAGWPSLAGAAAAAAAGFFASRLPTLREVEEESRTPVSDGKPCGRFLNHSIMANRLVGLQQALPSFL